jgi:hypothetical protein
VLTLGWNVIEAVVAITAGIAAGSLALVALGCGSIEEVLSAIVVVWQFRAELRGGYDENRERHALRFNAVRFFMLGAYIVLAGRSRSFPRRQRSQGVDGRHRSRHALTRRHTSAVDCQAPHRRLGWVASEGLPRC